MYKTIQASQKLIIKEERYYCMHDRQASKAYNIIAHCKKGNYEPGFQVDTVQYFI